MIYRWLCWLALLALVLPIAAQATPARLSPANLAPGVNPDTHLTLVFDGPPTIGDSGTIRIYDAADHSLVDTLDLSIPTSPNPTGRAPKPAGATGPAAAPRPTDVSVVAPAYQLTTIEGVDFHFFPIIVRGDTATVYPHHGALTYGHRYVVTIDPGVLSVGGKPFSGVGAGAWSFSTKAAPPAAGATRLMVSADGRGDFATVQGAIDFVPASPPKRVEIFIRDGDYEELVFFHDKSNVTFRGEDRDKVRVGYPNNSAFNPQAQPGPSLRPAFSIADSTDIQLSNFTIHNDFIGQAEALLITGARNVVDHMTLLGSGDALTLHGPVYVADSRLRGDGDTCLCYGPAFFIRTEIDSVGPFTWTRNPSTNHGNVFVGCTFIYLDKPLPWTVGPDGTGGVKVPGVLARLPRNGPPGSAYENFPYAEMVLIKSRTQGVAPEGWGPIEDDSPTFSRANLHLWEYDTTDMHGRRVDVSQRTPVARELTMPADAQVIADYSDPAFVLGGWKPVIY